jgi:hypothetical protein
MAELYSIHEYMETVNVESVWHENYRGTARLYAQQLLNVKIKMKTHQSEST